MKKVKNSVDSELITVPISQGTNKATYKNFKIHFNKTLLSFTDSLNFKINKNMYKKHDFNTQ